MHVICIAVVVVVDAIVVFVVFVEILKLVSLAKYLSIFILKVLLRLINKGSYYNTCTKKIYPKIEKWINNGFIV